MSRLIIKPHFAALNQRVLTTAVCIMLVVLLGACQEPPATTAYDLLYTYDQKHQYYPEKKWAKLASPELADWSIVKLEKARQYAETIHSSAVIVIENGVIVAEWGRTSEPFKLHSVRKSLMSAMIGWLVDTNLLKVQTTLKQLKITDIGGLSAEEESATIHDLLTARSGIYHQAAYETKGMETKRPLRHSHAPGTFWYYNNWDFNTLVTIFNTVAEKDFFEQFNESIAKPLEMEHFDLRDTAYYYEREISMHPAYLFRMSALDLARFGLLYLRNGKWKDQQIISADWVKKSINNYSISDPDRPERGYGYLWWLSKGVYYASGTGGQRLFILPDLNVVIVHRVDTESKLRIKSKPIWRLYDMIIDSKGK